MVARETIKLGLFTLEISLKYYRVLFTGTVIDASKVTVDPNFTVRDFLFLLFFFSKKVDG